MGKIRQPQPEGKAQLKSAEVVAIPYYAWAHRGKSEMTVWLPLWISLMTQSSEF